VSKTEKVLKKDDRKIQFKIAQLLTEGGYKFLDL